MRVPECVQIWAALDPSALPTDEITERARLAGLSCAGGPVETLKRLAWAQDFSRRGSGSASSATVVGSASANSVAIVPPAAAAETIIATLLDRPVPVVGKARTGGPEKQSAGDEPSHRRMPAVRATKRSRAEAKIDNEEDTSWAAVDVEQEERDSCRERLLLKQEEASDDDDVDGVPLTHITIPAQVVPKSGGSNWAQLAASIIGSDARMEGERDSDEDDVDGVPL